MQSIEQKRVVGLGSLLAGNVSREKKTIKCPKAENSEIRNALKTTKDVCVCVFVFVCTPSVMLCKYVT